MVGVEDHCPLLDCVAGVCAVRADYLETAIIFSPRRHGDTEKTRNKNDSHGFDSSLPTRWIRLLFAGCALIRPYSASALSPVSLYRVFFFSVSPCLRGES